MAKIQSQMRLYWSQFRALESDRTMHKLSKWTRRSHKWVLSLIHFEVTWRYCFAGNAKNESIFLTHAQCHWFAQHTQLINASISFSEHRCDSCWRLLQPAAGLFCEPFRTSSSFPPSLAATAAIHSNTASIGSLSSSLSIGSTMNGLIAFQ